MLTHKQLLLFNISYPVRVLRLQSFPISSAIILNLTKTNFTSVNISSFVATAVLLYLLALQL